MNRTSTDNTAPITGCAAIIFRLFWLMAGNAILIIVGVFIAYKKLPFLSIYDLAFWAIAVLLVCVRYIDIVYFHGDDANGNPATVELWRRYAAMLIIISLAGWLIAHAIAYFY